VTYLHESVLDIFPSFSREFEGYVNHMYLDVKGYVTTGIGNLINDVNSVASLPWRVGLGGPKASLAEILEHWNYLRSRQDLKELHYKYSWGAFNQRFRHVLTLDDESIDDLVEKKLLANAAHAAKQWNNFPFWPADAQLAVASMYWALGSLTKFPNCARLVAKEDWLACAAGAPAKTTDKGWQAASYACKIKEEGNAGVIPRNKANVMLFRNAADSVRYGLPVGQLLWPSVPIVTETSAEILEKTETLRKGDKSPAVRLLQQKLGLVVDGIFGIATETAVKKFQAANGLKADGVVGSKTWEKL
jgi:peptidoglycan hydrolase-like protein with peptidoglycan-binding domain